MRPASVEYTVWNYPCISPEIFLRSFNRAPGRPAAAGFGRCLRPSAGKGNCAGRPGTGVGKRAVAGHFAVVSRAPARPEGLPGIDDAVHIRGRQPEINYSVLSVEGEPVGAADALIDQVACNLDMPIVGHGRPGVLGESQAVFREKREKMRPPPMSRARWMAAHISCSVSPMPTRWWTPALPFPKTSTPRLKHSQ